VVIQEEKKILIIIKNKNKNSNGNDRGKGEGGDGNDRGEGGGSDREGEVEEEKGEESSEREKEEKERERNGEDENIFEDVSDETKMMRVRFCISYVLLYFSFDLKKNYSLCLCFNREICLLGHKNQRENKL
jgi:hypothetical protein